MTSSTSRLKSALSRLKPTPVSWENSGRKPQASLPLADGANCNICGWRGESFEGTQHCESMRCPQCGSIGRDRFLLYSFTTRLPYRKGLRILETSPRLDDRYRTMMRNVYKYTASDFDQSAHIGDIQIDLQDINLPDSSLDVMLSPHVLEHVPDTAKALREIHRVLDTNGRLYLQIPLLQGMTGVPSEPEFHGDNTPVFFRFGVDLTHKLREHGFTTTMLVTQRWRNVLAGDSTLENASDGGGGEFDLVDIVAAAKQQLSVNDDVVAIANDDEANKLGFLPAGHYCTWECIKQ